MSRLPSRTSTESGETSDKPTLAPHPGSPQEKALESDADIVIMGGAAGGGKTWSLVFSPIQGLVQDPHFRGVIFRRTFPQIKNPGSVLKETKDQYRKVGGDLNRADLEWSFPHPEDPDKEGAKLQLSHMQREDDCEDWDGAQLTFVGFDQLEQFTARQFFYLLGRLRSPDSMFEPYTFATCNPVPPGHWLHEFVKPWLDEDERYVDPDEAGERKYVFPKESGEWDFVEADETRTLEVPGKGKTRLKPTSVEFHPADVFDNPELGETYLFRLNALEEVDKKRKLKGDWKARRGEGFLENHEIRYIDEDEIPDDLSELRYWDLAESERTKKNRDPSHTAGVRGGMLERMWTLCAPDPAIEDSKDCDFYAEGAYDAETCPKCGSSNLQIEPMKILIVTHAAWFIKTGDAKTRRMRAIANSDGIGVDIYLEQEGGSSGAEIADKYKSEVFGDKFDVEFDTPTGKKEDRVELWKDLAETGRFWVVESGQWATDYVDVLEDGDPWDVLDATSGLATKAKEDLLSHWAYA